MSPSNFFFLLPPHSFRFLEQEKAYHRQRNHPLFSPCSPFLLYCLASFFFASLKVKTRTLTCGCPVSVESQTHTGVVPIRMHRHAESSPTPHDAAPPLSFSNYFEVRCPKVHLIYKTFSFHFPTPYSSGEERTESKTPLSPILPF